MKKNFVFICLMAMLVMPVFAQKKQLDWKNGEMPKLTNVKEIDDYLLTCDTIIRNLKAIDENLLWYKVQKVQVTENDGSISETYHIVDQNGNFRGKNEALKQTLDVISVCLLLPLEAANIGLQTPLYTVALPKLGLSAFKYGKYTKLGPQLAARCTTDVVDILKKLRKQGKAIRALKKLTDENGKLTDPNIDVSSYEGLEEFTEANPMEKTSKELSEILSHEQKADSSIGDLDDGALDIE